MNTVNAQALIEKLMIVLRCNNGITTVLVILSHLLPHFTLGDELFLNKGPSLKNRGEVVIEKPFFIIRKLPS